MTKPDYITKNDWNLLSLIYKDNFSLLKRKLEEKYPIQYLIGYVDFFGNKINVDERVLIPRFETELLVEKTIKYIKKMPVDNLSIIDIGTGSGCISISLAKEVNAKITAVDISDTALELAKENSLNNQVKIEFKNLDILKESLDYYDVIISNPPYVKHGEYTDTETKYEPQNAIFAETNGLEFYEAILSKANPETKLIALEIGAEQGNDVRKIAEKYFPNHQIILEKDYNNRNRYIFIA